MTKKFLPSNIFSVGKDCLRTYNILFFLKLDMSFALFSIFINVMLYDISLLVQIVVLLVIFILYFFFIIKPYFTWRKNIWVRNPEFFNKFLYLLNNGEFYNSDFKREWISWYSTAKKYKDFNIIYFAIAILFSVVSILLNVLLSILIIRLFFISNLDYLANLFIQFFIWIGFIISYFVISLLLKISIYEIKFNRFRWLLEDIIRVNIYQIRNRKEIIVNYAHNNADYQIIEEEIIDILNKINKVCSFSIFGKLNLSEYGYNFNIFTKMFKSRTSKLRLVSFLYQYINNIEYVVKLYPIYRARLNTFIKALLDRVKIIKGKVKVDFTPEHPLDQIKRILKSPDEHPYIDFKKEFDLSTQKNKAEFIKDTIALTNSSYKNKNRSFLFIGVKEVNGEIKRFCNVKNITVLSQQLTQHANKYISEHPYIKTYFIKIYKLYIWKQNGQISSDLPFTNDQKLSSNNDKILVIKFKRNPRTVCRVSEPKFGYNKGKSWYRVGSHTFDMIEDLKKLLRIT